MGIFARLSKELWTPLLEYRLKNLRYITVLSLAITGLWANATPIAGDPPGVAASSSDTTQPYVLSADTTQPSVVADTSIQITVPVIGNVPPTSALNSNTDGNDETPAADVYEDFDTTVVHAEKFDVLNFNDTVRIPMTGYVHPFNGNITSGFGFRKYRYHLGMDIDLNIGDSVKCAFDGEVRIAQRSKTYGYVVVVRHPNGLETYYAHLSKLLVKPNEVVKAGTILGLGGNTGHSFGSHLHFEVRYRGQPINPNYLIDFQKKCVRADTYNLTKSDFKYLSDVHKITHYSKKKKKGYVTYYNPGGPYYATPEARAIMDAVPDPVMLGTEATTNSIAAKKVAPKDSVASNSHPTKPVVAPQKNSAKNSVAQKTSPPQKKVAVVAPTKTVKTPTTKTAVAKEPAKEVSGAATYYTVKSGDSLYAIALHNKTTVDKLCALNGIKSTATLNVGKKLRVK